MSSKNETLNNFEIVKLKPEKFIKIRLIITTIFFISIALFVLNSIRFKNEIFESIVLKVLGLTSILLLLDLILNFRIQQPLKGKKLGRMYLEKSSIKFPNKIIDITELKNINFIFNEHEGEPYNLSATSLLAKGYYYSNGAENKIELKYKNGEIETFNFIVRNNYEIKQLREIFIEYYNKELFSFIRLTELLGIHDYEDIQKLKKTIANNG